MAYHEVIAPDAVVQPALALVAEAQDDQRLADRLDTADRTRWTLAEDVRGLAVMAPHLPQLPDDRVQQVYERIMEAEASVVGPRLRSSDYGEGTAAFGNELLVQTTPGTALLEAQHATDPVRKETGERGAADHGTGGLGLVVAEDVGGKIIVSRGLQTSNANTFADHPIKDELLAATATGEYTRFLSVHGCAPGKVASLLDLSEIHAVIGLGTDPTEEALDHASDLARRARAAWGLRVVIGNIQPHLNFHKSSDWDGRSFRDTNTQLKTDKNGVVTAPRIAAMIPHSTVNFMRHETGLPSQQLEISRSLRLTPSDLYVRPDPSAEAYGVYLGYELCRMALEEPA